MRPSRSMAFCLSQSGHFQMNPLAAVRSVGRGLGRRTRLRRSGSEDAASEGGGCGASLRLVLLSVISSDAGMVQVTGVVIGIVGSESASRAWIDSGTRLPAGSKGEAIVATLSDPQLIVDEGSASSPRMVRLLSCGPGDEAAELLAPVECDCSGDMSRPGDGVGRAAESTAPLKASSSSITSSSDVSGSSSACHVAGMRRPLRSGPVLAYRKPSASHI